MLFLNLFLKQDYCLSEQDEVSKLSSVEMEVQMTRSGDQTDKVAELEDEYEYEADSDCVSVAASASNAENQHRLEEINEFMDDTYSLTFDFKGYFPDVKKSIKTVSVLQKTVSLDLLDGEKKVTALKL